MSIWRVQLLGQLCAQREETYLTRFSTHKAASLLAFLALNYPRRFPREVLIDTLWPECELPVGRNRLSFTLSTLRRQLEPPPLPPGSVLLTTNADIGLHPETVTVDVTAFQTLQRTSETTTLPSQRLDLLLQALGLYRGELLPGFYDEWAISAQRRLSAAFVDMAGQVVHLLEERGEVAEALEWAQRALESDSFQEATHYAVIRLYATLGRHADALRQYEVLSRTLEEEYKTTPSSAIQRLGAYLRAHPAPLPKELQSSNFQARASEISSAPDSAARVVPVASSPHLPVLLTRFFGREEALQHLEVLFTTGHRRLLTLTGFGGSGKTRLAIECARHLSRTFDNAVTFVGLVDVTDASRIPDVVLSSLRLPRSPEIEPLEQICAHLSKQPSLLVLDNFEHLVEGGAQIVQSLLQRLPDLRCLITSRCLLNLAGEQEVEVPLLPLPPMDASPDVLTAFACAQMLVDRVQARRPAFGITAQNVGLVLELLRKLEGVPLAIELAAAQMRLGTLRQVLARLERRLDALSSPYRDTPDRHKTLRATLDGSYRLLDPGLQHFLCHLSVFRGGWTVAAAAAVAEDHSPIAEDSRKSPPLHTILPGAQTSADTDAECLALTRDRLTLLREHSLIGEEEREGELRYGMLETLREYTREHLNESEQEQVRERHLNYYLEFAEQADTFLRGPHQMQWLSRLDAEHDNFRAALSASLAVEERWESGLRLSTALSWFWYRRGYLAEGQKWLETFLANTQSQGETSERAGTLVSTGIIAYYLKDFRKSLMMQSEATRIYRRLEDVQGIAQSQIYQAITANFLQEHSQATAMLTECVALWREIGDKWRLGMALWAQGVCLINREMYEEAEAPFEESRALFAELGDAWGIGAPMRCLGMIAVSRGDVGAACQWMAQAVAAAKEAADPWRTAYFSVCLGDVLTKMGRVEEALELYEQSLALYEQIGIRIEVCLSLFKIARVYRSLDQREQSDQSYRRGLELAHEMHRADMSFVAIWDRPGILNKDSHPSLAEVSIMDQLIVEAEQALRDTHAERVKGRHIPSVG
jgi:predicted ATPase/DNA-binding SARP family transcriptional activator